MTFVKCTKPNKITALILALLLTLPLLCATVSANADDALSEYSCNIESVKLNRDGTLGIKVNLNQYFISEHKSQKLYLFELPIYEDALTEDKIVQTADMAEKVSFRVEYTDFAANDKFTVAVKQDDEFLPVTDFHYIDNLKEYSKNKTSFPKYTSIKGISFDELSAYGVGLKPSHTVIDVDLCDVLLTSYQTGAVEHICRNVSYYYNGDLISKLDEKIKCYTDADICVYFRILLSGKQIDGNLKFMYAASSGQEAEYYALDMSDEECVKYTESFFDFISERYSGKDNGFAVCYILGQSVNSNRLCNYYGKTDIGTYTENYYRLLRLCHNTVTGEYANSKVFVSIDNNFSARSTDLSSVGDEKLDYSAKEFLEHLCDKSINSGNFAWNVAVNATPTDGKNDFWNDSNALYSNETLFITARNLEILSAFLSSDRFCVNGNARRIIVDRFSLDTDNGGMGETFRAGAYSYAYFKAQTISGLDAFIYSDFISKDRGICAVNSSDGATIPFELAQAVKYVDSNADYELFNTLAAHLGVKSLSELDGDVPTKSKGSYSLYKGINATEEQYNASKLFENRLFDFANGSKDIVNGGIKLEYSGLKYDITENGTVLYAVSESLCSGEYADISIYPTEKVEVNFSEYITFRVKADSNRASYENLTIRLFGEGVDGETAICECNAVIKNSTWETVVFEIRDFADKCGEIEHIEFSVSPVGVDSDGESVTLSLLSADYKTGAAVSSATVIIWIILIVFAFALTISVVRLAIVQKKTKIKQIRFDF